MSRITAGRNEKTERQSAYQLRPKKTKSRNPSTDTRVGEDCYVVD